VDEALVHPLAPEQLGGGRQLGVKDVVVRTELGGQLCQTPYDKNHLPLHLSDSAVEVVRGCRGPASQEKLFAVAPRRLFQAAGDEGGREQGARPCVEFGGRVGDDARGVEEQPEPILADVRAGDA
jgi:hypothetical protein